MLFSIIFTAIFLTVNHLYTIFASPIISNGDVAAGQSLNLTHSKIEYYPPDYLCQKSIEWAFRACVTEIDDRTWGDLCINSTTFDRYGRLGSCPQNTMCMNICFSSKITIFCIGRPSDVIDLSGNQQTGVVKIETGTTTVPMDYTVSVPLAKSISAASVSALIEGMC